MKVFQLTKSIGSLLLLFALVIQLGCNSSVEVASSNESDIDSDQSVVMAQAPHAEASGYEFETPVRLMAGGEYVAVESPGYACPTMADVDGDGKLDLVVGQFNGSKMHFCKNIAADAAAPEFAKAEWIQSGSDAAQVPGVW